MQILMSNVSESMHTSSRLKTNIVRHLHSVSNSYIDYFFLRFWICLKYKISGEPLICKALGPFRESVMSFSILKDLLSFLNFVKNTCVLWELSSIIKIQHNHIQNNIFTIQFTIYSYITVNVNEKVSHTLVNFWATNDHEKVRHFAHEYLNHLLSILTLYRCFQTIRIPIHIQHMRFKGKSVY